MLICACMVGERIIYKTEFHGENVKIPFEVLITARRPMADSSGETEVAS
jgi:hypothetical protein